MTEPDDDIDGVHHDVTIVSFDDGETTTREHMDVFIHTDEDGKVSVHVEPAKDGS
jgi:hypothetical protein